MHQFLQNQESRSLQYRTGSPKFGNKACESHQASFVRFSYGVLCNFCLPPPPSGPVWTYKVPKTCTVPGFDDTRCPRFCPQVRACTVLIALLFSPLLALDALASFPLCTAIMLTVGKPESLQTRQTV